MSEAEEKAPSAAAQMFGDFAPAFVGFTDDTLFGQVWTRAELSPCDRSLVTVACLVAGGNTAQLVNHLARARRNGLTETELIEAITHLACYAGWPRAMSAMAVAKEVFGADRARTTGEEADGQMDG
jgi:4-carboxymuconolactone decarboxylase